MGILIGARSRGNKAHDRHVSLSNMKKLLSVDTAHLQDLLESLGVHHRVARSLDFLGSIKGRSRDTRFR